MTHVLGLTLSVLPKSLINGGQWYFMFWSALGIVSIGFIALVYIFSRPRKYPLLTISLGLALIMLLIPAVGAFFNGMMSASNRWTLLIYLPLAMALNLSSLMKIESSPLSSTPSNMFCLNRNLPIIFSSIVPFDTRLIT